MESALADLVDCVKNNKEPESSGLTALNSLEMISALWYAAEKEILIKKPFKKKIVLPLPQGDVRLWKKIN